MDADDAPEPGQDGDAVPSVDYRNHDHVAFRYARMFSIIWRLETTPDAVQRAQRLVQDFVRSLSPPRFCLLNIVEETADKPSAEARSRLQDLLRSSARGLIRSAVVYEGTGFRAAAVFGVATSLAVLSRHQFPHRVFAELGKATDWLALGLSGELGEPTSGFELSEAVRSVRKPGASALGVQPEKPRAR